MGLCFSHETQTLSKSKFCWFQYMKIQGDYCQFICDFAWLIIKMHIISEFKLSPMITTILHHWTHSSRKKWQNCPWWQIQETRCMTSLYAEKDTHNSYPHVLKRRELPLEVPVKSSYVNPSGDVDALREVIDVFEGTLNTIKDGAHDSGP